MWDYKKADTNSIKKALKQVNCESLFLNKTVHEQVLILNKTLLNVLSNHVPNKIFTVSDKDLLWMTQYLKSQINWHNNVYQEYHRKRNHSADDFIFLENNQSGFRPSDSCEYQLRSIVLNIYMHLLTVTHLAMSELHF